MKNAVFTIVAKNYLPYARTLGDSIFKIHKNDIDYFIFLVDEFDGLVDLKNERYKVIETRSIGIEGYINMAFKYDITEFSTSVKPFIISYLFNLGYNKIIYLDPDITVYNPLTSILKELDKYSMVLTPHINHPVENRNNATEEEVLLFGGIYNLGFVALKKDKYTRPFIEWLMEKLYHSCFDERSKSLFVDQKWMNYGPAFLGERLLVSRNPGYNMAVWNLHERSLKKVKNKYTVTDKLSKSVPLVFYHFSGYNLSMQDHISSKHSKASFEMYPELKEVFDNYRERLLLNGAPDDFKKVYTYGHFENGENIIKIQRRLYNSITIEGNYFSDPFSIKDGSFYMLLKKNKLLPKSKSLNPEKTGWDQIGEYGTKISIVYYIMKLVQRIVGIDRYALLLRFLMMNISYDAQLFLIKKRK